jgi:hypothetical protein
MNINVWRAQKILKNQWRNKKKTLIYLQLARPKQKTVEIENERRSKKQKNNSKISFFATVSVVLSFRAFFLQRENKKKKAIRRSI